MLKVGLCLLYFIVIIVYSIHLVHKGSFDEPGFCKGYNTAWKLAIAGLLFAELFDRI